MILAGHAIGRTVPGRVRLCATMAWQGRASHTASLRRGGSVVRHAEASLGPAWLSKSRLGKATHTAPFVGRQCGKLRCGTARRGNARRGLARHGPARQVLSRRCKASHTADGNARCREARHVETCRGAARLGVVRRDSAWLHTLPLSGGSSEASARYGEAMPGADRPGLAPSPSRNGRKLWRAEAGSGKACHRMAGHGAITFPRGKAAFNAGSGGASPGVGWAWPGRANHTPSNGRSFLTNEKRTQRI